MRFSLTLMALSLLTAEFLWPVEDAASGRGLHLVMLWLMLGMLHAVSRWRAAGMKSELRRAAFGATDLGILLIAVGHIVSTAVVFQVEGDRRAALNLTFQWMAIFAAWRLFRSLCLDRHQASQLVAGLVAIGVGLSAFGIWQHHVFYAEQSSWYLGKRAELDQAMVQGGSMQASSIVAEFQAADIPLEGSDRILWENRLLSSTEPFAMFSLANTLAGILATALVLGLGQLSAGWTTGQRPRVFELTILVVQLCLITYCLVLTKSRSAWLGATVGTVIVIVIRSRASLAVKGLRWGIAAAGLAGLIAAGAAFFGALDKEVILESPRSLQFRLLYWTGTLEMLKEQPLAGAGPGNFRQLYLAHKANESSEEIKDPHNFLLEAWSAGGLIGLSGMVLFVGSILRRLASTSSTNETPQSSTVASRQTWKVLPFGLLLGFALHAAWEWLKGHSFSPDQIPKLLLLAGVAFAIMRGRRVVPAIDSASALAAASALMVNLLAAGGIEMPAVMLMLFACSAVGVSLQDASKKVAVAKSSATVDLPHHWANLTSAFIFVGLAIVVLRFGLTPVYTAERQLSIAADAMYRQRNAQAALAAYQQAAEIDLFDTTSRQRIAEIEAYRLSELEQFSKLSEIEQSNRKLVDEALSVSRESMKELLPKAIEACDLLISTDRRNISGYRTRAVCLTIGARVLNDPEMLKEAIAEQQRVVNMYPSSVENWFELATLCNLDQADGSKKRARQAAEKTLELEQINRQWGHQDRYLAKDSVEAVSRMLSP